MSVEGVPVGRMTAAAVLESLSSDAGPLLLPLLPLLLALSSPHPLSLS